MCVKWGRACLCYVRRRESTKIANLYYDGVFVIKSCTWTRVRTIVLHGILQVFVVVVCLPKVGSYLNCLFLTSQFMLHWSLSLYEVLVLKMYNLNFWYTLKITVKLYVSFILKCQIYFRLWISFMWQIISVPDTCIQHSTWWSLLTRMFRYGVSQKMRSYRAVIIDELVICTWCLMYIANVNPYMYRHSRIPVRKPMCCRILSKVAKMHWCSNYFSCEQYKNIS